MSLVWQLSPSLPSSPSNGDHDTPRLRRPPQRGSATMTRHGRKLVILFSAEGLQASVEGGKCARLVAIFILIVDLGKAEGLEPPYHSACAVVGIVDAKPPLVLAHHCPQNEKPPSEYEGDKALGVGQKGALLV